MIHEDVQTPFALNGKKMKREKEREWKKHESDQDREQKDEAKIREKWMNEKYVQCVSEFIWIWAKWWWIAGVHLVCIAMPSLFSSHRLRCNDLVFVCARIRQSRALWKGKCTGRKCWWFPRNFAHFHSLRSFIQSFFLSFMLCFVCAAFLLSLAMPLRLPLHSLDLFPLLLCLNQNAPV